MLSLDVRGGLNNQRECVINGIIAAAELGLTLVLPRVHPIGRGNEKYAPRDATSHVKHWPTAAGPAAADANKPVRFLMCGLLGPPPE